MTLLLRHRLPLLLAFLLAASSHGSPSGDDSYDPSLCLWRSSTCGDLSINYPFYLYNKMAALRGNDGSYCGYPGLGIQCEDGEKAILQLGNQKYNVLNINYKDHTVSVVDQEVSVGDESCLSVDHNVTFPQNSWLSYPNSTVDYLFFFLNCSFSSGFGSGITCGMFNDDPKAGQSFVYPQRDVPPAIWLKTCQRVIEVPVLKKDILDYRDPKWWTGEYGRTLGSGFQLAWDQKKPAWCNRCERSKGQCGYNQTGEFVACLCSSGRVDDHSCSGSKRWTTATIAGISASASLLCLSILAFYLTYKYSSLLCKTKNAPSIESFLQKNGNIYPKRYTYAEVKRMTQSFAVKVGQGGFGTVYRGNLRDGREVAIKMLKDNKGDGEEFMNEVASISRTCHVNVVTLLGFCLQGSKRALIYEYMPKGSLERYAFNRNLDSESTLTWEKLFEIAISIARGLEYLHRGCNTRIVHFDIKPHNILLDQDFRPKISDFGLAKLCLNKESAISIAGARGTIGYIAPEVYSKQFGTISSKSDVYSYGMMVLEMVGARDKNNTNTNSESSSQYFPQWIYEHLDDYCISASEINGETTELVRKMIVVGLWCIQVTPTNRPTMTRVVEMLEGSTSTLDLPPKMLLS